MCFSSFVRSCVMEKTQPATPTRKHVVTHHSSASEESGAHETLSAEGRHGAQRRGGDPPDIRHAMDAKEGAQGSRLGRAPC